MVANQFTRTGAIAAGAYWQQSWDVPVRSGWKAIGVAGFCTSGFSEMVERCNVSGGKVNMAGTCPLKRDAGSKVTVWILYLMT